MAQVLLVVSGVSAHNGPGTTIDDRTIKALQIKLVERSVADFYIHMMSIQFLIVEAIVLDASRHILGLDALDQIRRHFGNQTRVFTHVLKVSATQGGTDQIHTRSQNDVFSPVLSFTAQYFAVDSAQSRIPSGCQRSARGQIGAGILRTIQARPAVPFHLRAHTVRAIGHSQFADSQSFHGTGGKFRIGMTKRNLFLQCQFFQQFLHFSVKHKLTDPPFSGPCSLSVCRGS